jgi:transposase-like protein
MIVKCGKEHHVRVLRAGSRDRYECLDCGKRLRLLVGTVVARTPKEADRYREAKRLEILKEGLTT